MKTPTIPRQAHNNAESQSQFDQERERFSTQAERIAWMMCNGVSYTYRSAIMDGIGDIRARVRDLRNMGIQVQHETLDGSTSRRWYLDDEGKRAARDVYRFKA